MFDNYEDSSDSDSSYFGTSPPRRLVIAESSDLFRAVMEECFQDEGRLSKAVIDGVVKRSPSKGRSDGQKSGSGRTVCNKSSTKGSECRCERKCRRDSAKALGDSHNRGVQWVDEICDKPLASEAAIDSLDSPVGSPTFKDLNIKPILKHRANCIIIISE